MGSHAYAVTNAFSGLAASAFTLAPNGAQRAFLNDKRMDKVFVADSASGGVGLVIDMGSATALMGIAVLNSNIASAGGSPALAVSAADDAAFTVNPVTAKAFSTLYTATSPRNKDHVLQFASVSKRYWALVWTWTGSFVLRIGEVFGYAASTQLSRRSVYGSGETHEAIVSQVQMQYGETRGLFQAGPLRQLDLQWDDLTETERGQLQTMHTASLYGANPLLWIDSYEATSSAAAATEQECIYGRLQSPRFQWTQKDFGLYQPGGFSLRSLGREAGA